MQSRTSDYVIMFILAALFCATGIMGADQNSHLVKDETWGFRIIKVERVEPSTSELELNPRIAAKWLVSTELTNNTKLPSLISKFPKYGGTVSGKIEPDIFLSGSRIRIKSLNNDFWTISPSFSLRATHAVFANYDDFGGKFTIYGHFLRTENIPAGTGGYNFSHDWVLRDTPVENSFEFSITLFDWYPPEAKKILGDEFTKVWHGQVLTAPVKMKIFEPVEKSAKK